MLNLNFKIFNEMHMGTNKYGKPFFKDINYITEPKRQTSITWNNNNETKPLSADNFMSDKCLCPR